MSDRTPEKPKHHDHSAKETAITLLISFAMALVFRSYVVEAFRIPTGSMAPTLLGENLPVQSGQTGYQWTTNPWYHQDGVNARVQPRVSFTDPMTTNNADTAVDAIPGYKVNRVRTKRRDDAPGYITPKKDKRVRPGDRILVLKYIYMLMEPTRFDVVVFKNPSDSSQNYIKRLVGLPGEDVLIVAGDIFSRIQGTADWAIRRKPHHVQRELWRPQYSSDFRPLDMPQYVGKEGSDDPWTFKEPWLTQDFKLFDHTAYRSDAGGVSALRWNDADWPVTDRVPYNEAIMTAAAERYPVPDLRMRAGVKPDAEGLGLSARIITLGHEFSLTIEGNEARLSRRPLDVDKPDRMKSAMVEPIPAGKVTNIAFCHVDQALQLWINDKLVVEDQYDDWLPRDRYQFATLLTDEEYEQDQTALLRAATYQPNLPDIEWEFRGPPVTLYRVGLDRDVYYEPYRRPQGGTPGLGTLPSRLASLNQDQYFCLGDNSPFSLDGRGWDAVDEVVADTIDDTVGVVPRKLMIGKAFFVYFPGPHEFAGRTLIPDTGHMRIIH